MSKIHGFLITFSFVAFFSASAYLRHFLFKRYGERFKVLSFILEWINVLLPTILLFILGTRWVFAKDYLPSQIPTDLTFSTFHLAMIILTVIGVLIYLRKANSKTEQEKSYFNGRMRAVDYEILKFGVNLVGIELFKQIIFLNLFGGLAAYKWNGFPLQYCSLPIYLYIIIPFLKQGKTKDALYSYVGLFSLLGGLSVMIIGGGVFNLVVSLSLHTMIWHGTMVVSALYVGIATGVGKTIKNFTHALYLFLGSVIMIQLINGLFHLIGFKYPPINAFDGFYINPWSSSQNVAYISQLRITLTNVGIPPIFTGLLVSLFYSFFIGLGGYLLYRFYQFTWKRKSNNKVQKQTLNEPPLKEQEDRVQPIDK